MLIEQNKHDDLRMARIHVANIRPRAPRARGNSNEQESSKILTAGSEIECEFDGVWFQGRVDRLVPAGVKILLDCDGTSSVIGHGDIARRVRGLTTEMTKKVEQKTTSLKRAFPSDQRNYQKKETTCSKRGRRLRAESQLTFREISSFEPIEKREGRYNKRHRNCARDVDPGNVSDVTGATRIKDRSSAQSGENKRARRVASSVALRTPKSQRMSTQKRAEVLLQEALRISDNEAKATISHTRKGAKCLADIFAKAVNEM